MKASPLNSPVMTGREVCEYLRISSATLHRLLKFHDFPAFKVGGDWRFNREQIEQWARDRERELREKGSRQRS